jgi:hypothetical protein
MSTPKGPIQFQVTRAIHEICYHLHGFVKGEGVWIAQPLQFREIEPGSYTQPIIRLEPEEIQGLLNEFWLLGFRPSRDVIAPQADAAMSAHLKDMRALVAKAYELELPK